MGNTGATEARIEAPDHGQHPATFSVGIADGIDNNAQLNMPVNQLLRKPGDY
jgi:hypothetical protein